MVKLQFLGGVEVNKPEIGNKSIQKGNVTIVDFKK